MYNVRKKQLDQDFANVKTMTDFSNFLEISSGKNLMKHSNSGVTFSHYVVQENKLQHIIILDDFYVLYLSENKNSYVFESCGIRPQMEDCESVLTVMLEKKKRYINS